MIHSNLCNYSDSHILVKETITITAAGAHVASRNVDKRNKQITFKSCRPFTDCISQINNTQAVDAKNVDVVMLML